MNVNEAARRLEVSVSTIYALVASGTLRHYRIGNGRGCVRISDSHIEEFLRQAERGTEAAPVAGKKGKSTFRHIKLPES